MGHLRFEIFTSDNHHHNMELAISLPKFSETYSAVHIGFQGTNVG